MSRSLIKRLSKALRYGFAFYSLSLSEFLISRLNNSQRQRLAINLAKLVMLSKQTRKPIFDHLRFAYGQELSESQTNRLVILNLVHMAHAITELLWWKHRKPQLLGHYISISGSEHIHAALDKGKGVIGITSHLGNWELLGGYISQFVVPISVIAEPVFDPRVNELLVSARSHLGVNTIYRKQSARSILGILRKNGFLGMLADQDIPSSESVFVQFFGKPALTPVGPAALVLKTGAAMVPMFIRRNDDGTHHVTVEPEIKYESKGDYSVDVISLTQLWSNVVERHIRARPDQWVWLHNRFATRPENFAT